MKPGVFPLGSLESRAAARLLAERQKAGLIPVLSIQVVHVGDPENSPLPWSVEMDPTFIEGDWDCWMTRQELEAAQRVARHSMPQEFPRSEGKIETLHAG